MDIQYLREFSILADMCNYQAAADVLHVSQSALSKHIQKLEDELGGVLFERTARVVTLSNFGAVFLAYARKIITVQEEALQHLQKMHAENGKTLVIAYPPQLERYGLIELAAGFRQRYSEIGVETVKAADAIGVLRARHCDFAFTYTDIGDMPDVGREVYQQDYIVAVLPEYHPLAGETSITIDQLKDEKFILHKQTDENIGISKDTLTHLCTTTGFEPTIAMSASFSSTIVSLVSQGAGIAIMQRLQVPLNISHVVAVKLEPTTSMDIQLVYLKPDRPSAIKTKFVEYVRSVAHKHIR